MNAVVAISVVTYVVLLGFAVWITEQRQQEMDAAIALRKNPVT